MGQEPAAPAPAEPKAAEPTEPKPADKPPEGETQTFDKEYVSKLRGEAADWRIKAQQATEKLSEYEEANKSELEKAQGKATKAEQRAAEAEAQLIRFEVAADKQLPKELVPRLRGNTREELEADADELLNLVKNRTETETKPDFDGGAREPAPETDPAKGFNDSALAALGLLNNT